MAIILNIETATEIGSVCVSNGENVLAEKVGSSAFSHAKETTQMIQDCLAIAELTMDDLVAVAVSKGPGSYTSLRIGTSIAKGICYAKDIPLIGVDTLQSMAMASAKVAEGAIYVPMIDARRMEVYTAFFDGKGNSLKETHALILEENTFEKQLNAANFIVFSGNGAEKLTKVKESYQFVFTDIRCAARHLIPLSTQAFHQQNFESVAYFEPDYLKPPNITTPKKVL
ncbi:MAG: tRNA (adenosine(37)-N6)-threonylcarbamoyltransferase complex dimerization subunit type 1 TsaB [Bacteroidota bacterium]